MKVCFKGKTFHILFLELLKTNYFGKFILIKVLRSKVQEVSKESLHKIEEVNFQRISKRCGRNYNSKWSV